MGNQQLTSCISSHPHSTTPSIHTPHTPDSPYSFSIHLNTDHFPDPYACKRNIKLLFLDVDGVLNHFGMSSKEKDKYGIDHRLLSLLRIIVQMTNCKIVLSTNWRLHRRAKRVLIHSIKSELDLNTRDLIVGQTPDLKLCGKHRSDEIEHFMQSNADRFHVVSWCAVDDISLDKYDEHAHKFMHGHFVKTNPMIGISHANVLRVVEILNSNLAHS